MTQVVFITGVSSGIGRASAIAFAKNGFHVAGMARSAEKLQQLDSEINNLSSPHGDFLGVIGDVSDANSVQSAVNQTIAKFGRLDILVANAGIGHRGNFVDADWHDIETLLRTNIDGVLLSIRACVPEMRKQRGGHIITISSVTFNLVSPYAATYAASKAFVSSMANSIRYELAPDNIKVSDFLVGRTDTSFNENRLGGGARKASSIPNMTPETVAEAVVKVVKKPKNTVILRLFDKLLVLGNRLVPDIIGKFAAREYK